MRRVTMAALAMFAIGCTSPAPATPSRAVVRPSPTLSATLAPSPMPTVSVAPTAVPTTVPTAAATVSSGATPPAAESPGASQVAFELDPCTLLDPAVDLALLGGSTGDPHAVSPTDWGPQCDYPTSSGVVQVVTFLPQVSDSVFESADSKVEISALGDTAFYDTEWDRLRVRVGSDRFQVSCFCILQSGTGQAILVQLATSAVARLLTQ